MLSFRTLTLRAATLALANASRDHVNEPYGSPSNYHDGAGLRFNGSRTNDGYAITSTATRTVTIDEETCPFMTASADYNPYDIDDGVFQQTGFSNFLTILASACGSVACCTLTPLTNYVVTWSSLTKQPVTVGTEVVVIDTARGVTTTTTEVVTEGIVATINGETTTIDPSQWLNNGTFDGGSGVPTQSTTTTDGFGKLYTIRYPSAFVQLATALEWYGSVPIVSADTTSCLQNTANYSSIASPTYISTPTYPADATDPKGLFYSLIGEGPQQIPGGDGSGKCGGTFAAQLTTSWSPSDLIVSVYSSCYCSYAPKAPAYPAQVASFLLESSTRFARITDAVPTSTPASQAASPAPDTNVPVTSATPVDASSQPTALQDQQSSSPRVTAPSTASDETTSPPAPSPSSPPQISAQSQNGEAPQSSGSPQSTATSTVIGIDNSTLDTPLPSASTPSGQIPTTTAVQPAAPETSQASMGIGDIIASVMGETDRPGTTGASSTSSRPGQNLSSSYAPAQYTGEGTSLKMNGLFATVLSVLIALPTSQVRLSLRGSSRERVM